MRGGDLPQLTSQLSEKLSQTGCRGPAKLTGRPPPHALHAGPCPAGGPEQTHRGGARGPLRLPAGIWRGLLCDLPNFASRSDTFCMPAARTCARHDQSTPIALLFTAHIMGTLEA